MEVIFCHLYLSYLFFVSLVGNVYGYCHTLWRCSKERRIVDLKKRIEQLRSELDAGTSELQDAKQFKEIAEQELRGYEVELAMNEACFQTLETRVSLIQDEIFIAGSSLEVLKVLSSPCCSR